MKKAFITYFALFFMMVSMIVQAQPSDPFKVIGYYANWSMYRNPAFYPKDIDAKLLTHINYAFLKVDPQGNIALIDPWADIDHRTDWNSEKPFWGNFRQLVELKQQNPSLKTLISVGGWTLSDTFSQMAAHPSTRQNFIQQIMAFCEKYQFDGIDIDWEYPGFADHNGRPEDKQNFTQLLMELYQAAKAHNPPLLVTIAAPAGPTHYQNMEVSEIHHYLDWLNLMGYDFHGPWQGSEDNVTNHQAALYATQEGNPQFNVDSAVKYYLSQGFPPEKIVVGMPLYGRSYTGVASTTDGLHSPYQGVGQGSTSEAGILFLFDIKQNFLNQYVRYWDDQAKVPYLYNPTTKQFISYDDEESLKIKSEYVKEHHLGGAMVWELGEDTRPAWDGMHAIYNTLNSK